MSDRAKRSPWADFLAARAECIDWMFADGKTPDEIARAVSADGDQVLLIALRHRLTGPREDGGA